MNSELSPAPVSLSTITRRRSQRSASTPARGAIAIFGSTHTSILMAKRVAEPVCWYTQTPTAKLVKPEPSVDTGWPAQTMIKTLMPLDGTIEAVFKQFALAKIRK